MIIAHLLTRTDGSVRKAQAEGNIKFVKQKTYNEVTG